MQPDDRAKPAEMEWPRNFAEENYNQFGPQTAPTASLGGGGISSPTGMTGQIVMWPTTTVPVGWLLCDGTEYNAADYPNLFEVLFPYVGAVTVNSTTDIVTLPGHGLVTGDRVVMFSEGVLPTAVIAITLVNTQTSYPLWVTRIDDDTFYVQLSSNTAAPYTDFTGTGTGIHHVRKSGFFSTLTGESYTFNVPNFKGRVPVGVNVADADYDFTIGDTGGEKTHLLTGAESGVKAHTHNITDPGHVHLVGQSGSINNAGGSTSRVGAATTNSGSATTGITISNAAAADATNAHNNMQPFLTVNFIIKA